ncbi:RNA recognition motif domain-containing protein [Dongshaea marina]|uniref:RNA recognition motif domain-containing protein n=1 Tax=Dongshaea marina TaxID=2047966 RepID=UPI000D3EC886|nr:RNA-binding protein [Dongshaea marina]
MKIELNGKTFLRAVLAAIILAAVGYLVAHAMHWTLDHELVFAIGLAIGGFAVALFMPGKRVTTLETKTLYVGNLPYRANEVAVRTLFETYGRVLSVRLMIDKETGKRRGYGFVEMLEADANQALAALNESEYRQRTLKVREANEKKEPINIAPDEND